MGAECFLKYRERVFLFCSVLFCFSVVWWGSVPLEKPGWARKIAQWWKGVCCQAWGSEFDSQNPHAGKRKPTPYIWGLWYTHTSVPQVCTYTHTQINNRPGISKQGEPLLVIAVVLPQDTSHCLLGGMQSLPSTHQGWDPHAKQISKSKDAHVSSVQFSVCL